MCGYEEQFPAAYLWTVNHNLGRCPAAVAVRTLGGVVVDVECYHTSPNQLQVRFDVPLAGIVSCQ